MTTGFEKGLAPGSDSAASKTRLIRESVMLPVIIKRSGLRKVGILFGGRCPACE